MLFSYGLAGACFISGMFLDIAIHSPEVPNIIWHATVFILILQKGRTYMGIRMISQVSYGSSNQSTLPETYYQF